MIVFYRGTSMLSRAIRWFTRSHYSHVAYEQSNGNLIEAWTHGVRMVADYATDHTAGTAVEWYRVEGVTPEQRERAETFMRKQLGKKYDVRGILGFLRHRDIENQERWFCSELVFEAFRQAGVELLARVPAFKVSPGDLNQSPRLILVKSGVC